MVLCSSTSKGYETGLYIRLFSSKSPVIIGICDLWNSRAIAPLKLRILVEVKIYHCTKNEVFH